MNSQELEPGSAVDAARWNRLGALAQGLARDGRFVAVLGCGSCGPEFRRLDRWSDLDFFAVARPEFVEELRSSVSWLEAVAPLAWSFRFLDDAWKVLFSDGILAEFGVVTEQQLADIAYSPARLLWALPEFDRRLLRSKVLTPPGPHPVDYWAQEAGWALLASLGRFWRGEKLAAWAEFHETALASWMEIVAGTVPPTDLPRDPFLLRRRFEVRFPTAGPTLVRLEDAWGHLPRAALVLLDAILELAPLNEVVVAAIRARAQGSDAPIRQGGG